MTAGEHGGAVTSTRDTLAAARCPCGHVVSSHYRNGCHVCGRSCADALLPTVEAMLAQARAEVVAAVEAVCVDPRSQWFHTGGTPCTPQRDIRAALAAVSGTDHDTTLDTVRAAALRDAADGIDALHPESAPKNSAVWLRTRADRIAPDDTPSEQR